MEGEFHMTTDPKPTPGAGSTKQPESASFKTTVRRDTTGGVLYVGIDLGTSHTAISASNGTRAVFDSIVGYPKDVVSRKLLKKEVLYGKEALENRLALRMFRPLERGAIKYSDDAAGSTPEEIEGNLDAAKAL